MPSTFDAKFILLAALALVTLFYIVVIVRGMQNRRSSEKITPSGSGLGTGFVTNFLDTLGIGSFATTTSIFRFLKMVPDERIPGTLNVGHTLPTIVQAFIYTRIVPVESFTLITMILASVLGAWLGAGVVSGWSKRRIQFGMGICLFLAAVLLAAKASDLMPSADVGAIGVSGVKLGIAFAGNFVLGALMTLGIGLYAPCMILVALLGMNVKSAYPIMMGSCAFLMPAASTRFVRSGTFDWKASLGLALGGIPGVVIAAYIVKEMPLKPMMWLVVLVMIYTATTLVRSARSTQVAAEATAAEATAGA